MMNVDMAEWSETGLRLAIGSTIILASGLCVIFACRRHSSATRHLAGSLICFTLLLLPVAVLCLPTLRLDVLAAPAERQVPDVIFTTRSSMPDADEDKLSPPIATPPALGDSTGPSERFGTEEFPAEQAIPSPILPWVMGLYLVGVVLSLLRLVVSLIHASRLAAESEAYASATSPAVVATMGQFRQSRRVVVKSSRKISVPMVTGIFRPTVLLPLTANKWPIDQVRCAISHELAHIERRDLVVQLMTNLSTCVYWPNPLMHVLTAIMRRDREAACDDVAVSKCTARTVYARQLLEIAMEMGSRKSVSKGMLAMARRSNVEWRIAAILSRTRQRCPPSRRTAILLLAATLVSLFSSVCFNPFSATDSSHVSAQELKVEERPAEPESEDVASSTQELHASGQVVDVNGAPVANALILAPQADGSGNRSMVTHRADDQGHFELSFRVDPLGFNFLHTWFYAEGHGVRVAAMGVLALRKKARVEDLQIPLPESQRRMFQVFRPDGAPCENAVVRPYQVHVPNGTFMADEYTGVSMSTPEELLDVLGSTTDRDGQAAIKAIPPHFIYTVSVDSEDYGRQTFQLADDSLAKLELADVGAVRGRVIADDPETLAGTKVTVETDSNDHSRIPRGIATVELDAEGVFEIPAIAAWPETRISFNWDQTLDFQPVLGKLPGVTAGKTLELNIATKPVVTLTGKVLTADTGEPVAGAKLAFRNPIGLTDGIHVVTEQDGSYSARVPPGNVKRQLYSMGRIGLTKYYDYPRLAPLNVPSDAEEMELDPIFLSPQQVLSGRLQDTSGDPIAGETVALHDGQLRFLSGQAVTERDGTFAIHVRDWEFQRRLRRSYWVIVEREADGTSPPAFITLDVLDEDPEGLVLQKPR